MEEPQALGANDVACNLLFVTSSHGGVDNYLVYAHAGLPVILLRLSSVVLATGLRHVGEVTAGV